MKAAQSLTRCLKSATMPPHWLSVMFRALTVVPSTLKRRYLTKRGEELVQDRGPGQTPVGGKKHCNSPLHVWRRCPPAVRERHCERQQGLKVVDTSSGREVTSPVHEHADLHGVVQFRDFNQDSGNRPCHHESVFTPNTSRIGPSKRWCYARRYTLVSSGRNLANQPSAKRCAITTCHSGLLDRLT